MELNNINVIQGQSSSIQDFRCAVRWPGKEEKPPTKHIFFIDHCDQTSMPIHPPQLRIDMKAYTLTLEVADLWGPETHKQNL